MWKSKTKQSQRFTLFSYMGKKVFLLKTKLLLKDLKCVAYMKFLYPIKVLTYFKMLFFNWIYRITGKTKYLN